MDKKKMIKLLSPMKSDFSCTLCALPFKIEIKSNAQNFSLVNITRCPHCGGILKKT